MRSQRRLKRGYFVSERKLTLTTMDTPIRKDLFDEVAAYPRPFNLVRFGETLHKGFCNVWETKLLTDITLVVGKEKVRQNLFAKLLV